MVTLEPFLVLDSKTEYEAINVSNISRYPHSGSVEPGKYALYFITHL